MEGVLEIWRERGAQVKVKVKIKVKQLKLKLKFSLFIWSVGMKHAIEITYRNLFRNLKLFDGGGLMNLKGKGWTSSQLQNLCKEITFKFYNAIFSTQGAI